MVSIGSGNNGRLILRRAVIAVVLLTASGVGAVWLNDVTLNTCFYPFTNQNDTMEICDDCCEYIDEENDRGFLVPFLGGLYDYTEVDINGGIYFDDDCRGNYCRTLGGYVVAFAYYMDADIADNDYGGMIYAGIHTDAAELAVIAADLIASGLADPDFTPVWAIVTTWKHVPSDEDVEGEYVSYQMVIVTDQTKTFAIYKYGVLTIPGPATEDNQCYHARIGFAGEGVEWYYKSGVVSGDPANGEANSLLAMNETNCGVPGMLVFDVTDAAVVEPAPGAQCLGECGDCTGIAIPSGVCARCTVGSTDQCYFAGFCFDVGTMVANLDCTLACTCEEGGKWDKCNPLKKDSDPRKMACLVCRADGTNEDPCSEEGVGAVVFGDSTTCSMAECLLSANPKTCGKGGVLPCSPADVDAKYLVGKVPMLKGKAGWVNWCNAVDPPTAE